MEDVLAIIPARGGSKGVENKNIKLLCGRPLLEYTVEAAQRSSSIGRIVLSTEDSAIAAVGTAAGAEVPFMRPESLARDDSPAIDAYIYTVERLSREQGGDIPYFVVLQPTSPFRRPADIDDAIALFFEKNADSVISVCEAPHPPLWTRRMAKDGQLGEYFSGESVSTKNRQDLDEAYIPNGAVFVLKTELLTGARTYYSDRTYGHVMPRERSIDIDTPLDFEFAEFLMGGSQSAGA